MCGFFIYFFSPPTLTCSRALWQPLRSESGPLIIPCMLKWSHLTFTVAPSRHFWCRFLIDMLAPSLTTPYRERTRKSAAWWPRGPCNAAKNKQKNNKTKQNKNCIWTVWNKTNTEEKEVQPGAKTGSCCKLALDAEEEALFCYQLTWINLTGPPWRWQTGGSPNHDPGFSKCCLRALSRMDARTLNPLNRAHPRNASSGRRLVAVPLRVTFKCTRMPKLPTNAATSVAAGRTFDAAAAAAALEVKWTSL